MGKLAYYTTLGLGTAATTWTALSGNLQQAEALAMMTGVFSAFAAMPMSRCYDWNGRLKCGECRNYGGRCSRDNGDD